jgi:hypothetical protein
MKKFFLVALLGLAGAGAMGQGVNVGVRAGWNNAKINMKELKVTSHNGYMAGAFARFNMSRLYLEPSLNFARKKCEAREGGIQEALSYSSVDIPLVLGVYIINARIFKLRGFVGPEASILTKKLKFKDLPADLKSDRTMWNGKVGGGLDVGNVSLEVDYSFGLKDFGNTLKKPRAFTLALGFKLF